MTKWILPLMALLVTPSAFAFTRLDCRPYSSDFRKEIQIEVLFGRSIDPLHPVIGNYYVTAELRVKEKNSRNTYVRPDVQLYPEKGTADTNLRGGATGMVHLRLNPQFKDGIFVAYFGDLFVNDLDVKAYFNLVGSGSEPGMYCKSN